MSSLESSIWPCRVTPLAECPHACVHLCACKWCVCVSCDVLTVWLSSSHLVAAVIDIITHDPGVDKITHANRLGLDPQKSDHHKLFINLNNDVQMLSELVHITCCGTSRWYRANSQQMKNALRQDLPDTFRGACNVIIRCMIHGAMNRESWQSQWLACMQPS